MKTSEEYEAEITRLNGEILSIGAKVDEWRRTCDQRIKALERSAASAREIARLVMTHTGTRGMRVSVENTNAGLSVIVCDPAGDEAETVRKMAKFLDASLWAQCGVVFSNEPGKPVGSSE